jgi:hypothetical protein
MTASPFCKMCQARNIPDQTDNVGHIQGYSPALELPRIAAHNCIWRERGEGGGEKMASAMMFKCKRTVNKSCMTSTYTPGT